MDPQSLMDGLTKAMRMSRKGYHLSLGGLIGDLKKASDECSVVIDGGGHPGRALSYRGYYEDLAFAPSDTPITVGEFRIVCQAALDATFTGYKGGDFVMTADTPLWISSYGTASGQAITGTILRNEWEFVLQTRQVD